MAAELAAGMMAVAVLAAELAAGMTAAAAAMAEAADVVAVAMRTVLVNVARFWAGVVAAGWGVRTGGLAGRGWPRQRGRSKARSTSSRLAKQHAP